METMRMKPNLSGSLDGRQAGVCRLHRQQGFSLMELIVVIAIVGIMASIAIPSFSSWRARSGTRNAAQSLLAHLKQARTLAFAENRSVSITFTSTSYTFDADTTGSCGPCRNEQVTLGQFSSNLAITRQDIAEIPTTKTFSSRGTANSATIYLCASGYSRRIVLNIIGRAYACGSGDTSASCTNTYNCQ